MSLTAAEMRFLQGVIDSPADKRVSEIARRCSDEFRVGTRIGQRFAYAQADVERAKGLLQVHGLPLTAGDHSDRASAVNRPGMTEKSGTDAPHQDSVAYRLFNGSLPVGVGYSVAQAGEVSAITAQVLMVVENFETFRQLHRYAWVMERMRQWSVCLVVFRGDTTYSTGDALRCVHASELPKIGFHDFDPAGLTFSAQLDGLVEHLAPPIPVLVAAVKAGKRSDLYFSHLEQYAAGLEAVAIANIPQLWLTMRRLQKGLPQEWMRDVSALGESCE